MFFVLIKMNYHVKYREIKNVILEKQRTLIILSCKNAAGYSKAVLLRTSVVGSAAKPLFLRPFLYLNFSDSSSIFSIKIP